MTDKIKSSLHEALNQQLGSQDLDVLDVVPIPSHGDRMVRLRTLEDILETFNGDSEEEPGVSYVIHVKQKAAPRAEAPAEAVAAGPVVETKIPSKPADSATDGVYLANGKLNIEFLLQNAELLIVASDFPLARNIYKAVLATGEKSSVALFGLGRCAEAEGKLDEARAAYEESIAYHPTLESYRSLGLLLTRMEKDQLAAEVFESALALRELQPAIRFDLHKAAGNCWTRAAGREARFADNAERHYRKALEIQPSADEICANIGTVKLLTGRFAEAKRHFQDAIASNPKNHKALSGMGSVCLQEGDKRGAHDHFAQSLDAHLNDANAVFNLVKCAYEIKSYATAARIVEEYIEVAPVNANLLYSLAGLQFHLGRMNSVRATIGKILQLAPTHQGALDLQDRLNRLV